MLPHPDTRLALLFRQSRGEFIDSMKAAKLLDNLINSNEWSNHGHENYHAL